MIYFTDKPYMFMFRLMINANSSLNKYSTYKNVGGKGGLTGAELKYSVTKQKIVHQT